MDQLLIYILITFAAITAIQLFYQLFFMFRLTPKSVLKQKTNEKVPLSIVICAKNEGYNLKKNIPQILNQKYPNFQVIVVNDCSEDDTDIVLAELKESYPQLYYTSIPIDHKFSHGKKLAITIGIKAAKTEHIVFIDADCTPASDNWLSEIASKYTAGKQLIIGYGRYAKYSGLLNVYIRYETMWNAIQYMGFAKALRPFMGVGRNISYTKTLYNQSSKYRNNLSIASGDDDMFVSEMGTKANTAICFLPDGQTISEPQTTIGGWMNQKSRHLSTATHYSAQVKCFLIAETITRQIFWLLALILFIFGENNEILIATASLTFARILTIYLAIGLSAKRLGERHLWLWALPMDIVMPWMQALAWYRNIISKKNNTWK